jgi:hypothetical protein
MKQNFATPYIYMCIADSEEQFASCVHFRGREDNHANCRYRDESDMDDEGVIFLCYNPDGDEGWDKFGYNR